MAGFVIPVHSQNVKEDRPEGLKPGAEHLAWVVGVGGYLSGKRDIPFPIFIDMSEARGLRADDLVRRAEGRAAVSTPPTDNVE